MVMLYPNTKREMPIVIGKIRSEASTFRKLAATCNYLACDRLDIRYSVKEICRQMSFPTVGGLVKLKRLARYLLEVPELEMCFNSCVSDESLVRVYAVGDWAGCTRTGKYTSGGVMVFGRGSSRAGRVLRRRWDLA